MRTLVVEGCAEAIELLLLCRQCPSWRFRRIFLQRAVHPFVPTVLLRLAWLDALLEDAELGPAER